LSKRPSKTAQKIIDTIASKLRTIALQIVGYLVIVISLIFLLERFLKEPGIFFAIILIIVTAIPMIIHVWRVFNELANLQEQATREQERQQYQ